MNEIQAEKLDRFVNSVNNEVDEKTVSYTHLTLPTNSLV